ncbi:UTP--glucose-1-phosphate uridylyltransferase family protein [Chlamydia ibidis]|uniref:UTP--glucose-1-phosphate uridylyltransferase family protein n=2 Tax=Chlamydia ibidis TaxID=1405396 RepID=S7J1Y5_9CHLA|nr:UTP--glucose-1-phosphate uridylyltransferase [Chlamydia ibidis]EPP34429.1 UTP--glucose-1-phosphate uridylyltransferase family protein [Chlamydia ibidis]EQM62244.1 UTP--glucose-1-phosphate uridylyltransferase family protein [Chlamydia ibidis 10-1398/6]
MTDSVIFPSILEMSPLKEKLKSINQEHLLDFWPTLSPKQQQRLSSQITSIDVEFFNKQRLLVKTPKSCLKSFRPLTSFGSSGEDPKRSEIGTKLLEKKKVACVVLAGGQGSRLKCDGPKGLFPVSPLKKKPLFQLVAEKVCAASKLANQPLPLAFMTSPLNNRQTRSYFESNDYFGLDPHQVDFFCQPLWPLLSKDGDLFLEDVDTLALGPNGNGCLATLLCTSGLWNKWHSSGIEMVSVIPIDNPLALPFDVELCGFHAMENNDVTIKAALRQTAIEDVGILVESYDSGKTSVIEYSEIPIDERYATHPDNTLKYCLANIGLYCLSMDFIAGAAHKELPLYKAYKYAKRLDTPHCSEKNSWKFEEFIFDLFRYSQRCRTLVYPRQECFAPLKNLEGNYSLATVREALSARERQIFHKVTGKRLSPNTTFELEADFYYPSTSTSLHWENKAFFEEPFFEAS